ncbi:hypothetical protein CAI21_03660 [Alkalilimnicola ehrlichii]|uniref:DUF4337 domain-containing protein n=2 Tax=Alkalilimnicola ehrlichii TaxID=351052 RepID=A0A3E0WYV8_9GAMM|nr:hypothetical protein [Alkalilimnicola ehrlichii]RFA30626.1 hypothetical protein CAI21_03660 [Alkalilimnicola ehrlichii]RFA38208.1 hypothetical protein CAL65_05020 [Alkalilimnicola ehrlichii]
MFVHRLNLAWLVKRTELISAILLSIATVGTAWCSYQSAVWGGIQAFKLSDANRLSRESIMQRLEANQEALLEAGHLAEFIDARVRGDDALAQFYYHRFRPAMREAVDAWLATDPFEDAAAPTTPFEMPQYDSDFVHRADALESESARVHDAAAEANHRSDMYLLATVMLASVLFFAGIAPKFSHLDIRFFLLGMGSAMLTGAAVLLIRLPAMIT